MTPASPNLERAVWGGLFVIVLVLAIAYVNTAGRPRPVPAAPLPVIGPVADFTLTNQLGRAVTLADLRGKVWVADIIFTRCPGPCATMTRQMASLQAALPDALPVRLVSLTTDPEFDTPEVLRGYGERFGARPPQWSFLTGSKPQIAALAVDSLKLVATEKAPAERTSAMDLFIHSTLYVVVDKQGRLRAAFETVGDGVNFPQVQSRILSAMNQLLNEK